MKKVRAVKSMDLALALAREAFASVNQPAPQMSRWAS